ncbi:hypothetical protein ACFYUY_33575 [Kitasatospora sp. NPDC004745]|uniref:hypothetical protein n=1 Tax=Kitasatospora sp. NPDC004745 TaxID=3364019 RepID=UPI0036789C6D
MAVAAAGLWLAHNYRRQLKGKLTERMLAAYLELWELTAVSDLNREPPMTDEESRQLAEEMMTWYYANGNGMLMSPKTRALFFTVRGNLVAPVQNLQPASVRTAPAEVEGPTAGLRITCIRARQLSVLRTRLKTDMAMYFGARHLRKLRRDEWELLRLCGMARNPVARIRASRWLAKRLERTPCFCGQCN